MEKKPFAIPMVIKYDFNQIPSFVEQMSKDWILYGKNNLFPDYVIDLYQRSAKHNAIINGKVNYMVGGGWEGTNSWIEKVNEYETLTELTRKLMLDMELFNGFAIEIIYAKGTGKIAEMYHVDFSKIRTNKDESKYFYSDNWKSYNQSPDKTNYAELEPFNMEQPSKTGKQLYVFTIKSPRKAGEPNVYPIPEYMGALSAIETDVEISNFHLTNIKTGFSAGTMLNLYNGTPTDEEATQIDKKFRDKFTGTDRAGAVMINFAIDKEHGADVVNFTPSDLDKQYAQLAERVDQEIYTGHKITSPMLFGVKQAGQLGGRTELLEAYELFQATYIDIRVDVIENTFNKLASLSGMPNDMEIKSSKPLGMVFSEQTLTQILSRDEMRQIAAENMGIVLQQTTTPSPAAPAQPQQMRSMKDIEVFKKYGVSRQKFESVLTRTFFAKTDEEVKQLFAEEDEIETPDIPAKDLPKGKAELPPRRTTLKVMYSYEWRKGFNDADLKNSREFCKTLIDLDRYYSRADIENISGEVGYNVFVHTGGFWNNKGVIEPHCRHRWVQHVLIER